MALSILRRDYLAGAARVSASGQLLASGGRVLTSVRTGAGTYELGLDNIDPSEHIIHAKPVSSTVQNLCVNLEPVSRDLLRVRTIAGTLSKFDFYSGLFPTFSDLVYYPSFPDLAPYNQWLLSYWVKQEGLWGTNGFALHVGKTPEAAIGVFPRMNFSVFGSLGGYMNIWLQRLSDAVIVQASSPIFTYVSDVWYHNMVSFDLTHADPTKRLLLWTNGAAIPLSWGAFDPEPVFPTLNPMILGGQSTGGAGNDTNVYIDETAIWLNKIGSAALATEVYNNGTPTDLVASSLGRPDFWPRAENNFADSGSLACAPSTNGNPGFSTDVPFNGTPLAAQDTEFFITARRTRNA